MKLLKGCGTALITPFNKDGSIDYLVFRKLVKRQIHNGVNFLVLFGTTGEAASLDDNEKMRLLEVTIDEGDGKVPVIGGVIANTTVGAIKTVKLFQKTAIDGLLVITPYYNQPMQNGLYNHFKAVALTTDKSIILYNLPSNTGVNLNSETCLRLAEIRNIIGVKDGSGDYRQVSEIIRCAPRDFIVLSGRDNETLSLMATGAQGVISGIANIAPKEISTLTKTLLQNNIIAARKIHHRISPLFTACSLETTPIVVKAGMCKMGLIENILRPPLYPAARKTTGIIDKVIKELGLRK